MSTDALPDEPIPEPVPEPDPAPAPEPEPVPEPPPPILTDAQKAAIRARLAEPDAAGLDTQAACELLNAPTVIVHPGPPPKVYDTFRSGAFTGQVSPAAVGALTDSLAFIYVVIPILDKNPKTDEDMAHIREWADVFTLKGAISPEDRTKINTYLDNQTHDDPAWEPESPGPNWIASTFPDAWFPHPDGSLHNGQCTPAMIEEAR